MVQRLIQPLIAWIVFSSVALVAAAWLIWNITGAEGFFLNGVITFSGVVFSAAIGFTGLMISNNQVDRLRREALDEQREHERKVLAAALAGEARSNVAHIIGVFKPASRRAKEGLSTNLYWPQGSSAIFKANAGNIGLLGPELVLLLTELYGKFDLWNYFERRQAGEYDADAITQIVEEMENHDIKKWKYAISALIEISQIEQPTNQSAGQQNE